MTIISQLATLYKTPFFAAFLDPEKDVKQQKQRIAAELCGICRHPSPLNHAIRLFNGAHRDDAATAPNCVAFKIPPDLIIVDTDDPVADARFRSLFPADHLDGCAFPSISRALGINPAKGYHYYHVAADGFQLGAQKWQNKGGDLGDLDILGCGGADSGFVIEHIDTVLPEHRVLPMTRQTFALITGGAQPGRAGEPRDTSAAAAGDFLHELEPQFRNAAVWRKWADIVPNPADVSRDEWLSVAKFFYKHFPEEGFDIFSVWSEKWHSHCGADDARMWRSIKHANETTVGTPIYFLKKWAPTRVSEWFDFVAAVAGGDAPAAAPFFGSTDEDFSLAAYQRLRRDFVYSQGQLFFRDGHIWSNDARAFQSALRTSVIALKMKKRVVKEVKGGTTSTELLYCEMVKNLKNVCVLTEDKIVGNPDPAFYQKLHSTTLGKLCFNDGVYDFRTRRFCGWGSEELQRDPVYSLTKIHRNFPRAVDAGFQRECYAKVFEASMGAESAGRWVAFLARAVAGEIQDKRFATILTDRDCSKGVTNDWLMSAFGAYVRQAESRNFLVQKDRSATDAAKENGWLVDFQTVRLMLVQEFPLDMTNRGMKINSALIKSINSGGDKIEGRKNFKDASTFNIQCASVFMVNDLPSYTTEDVLEACIQLTSTIQFKSKEYIERELLDAAGNDELVAFRKRNYKLADPHLREHVKTDAWADALVRIMIDHYGDAAVVVPKPQVEGEQDVRLDERVLATFCLSGRDGDFTANDDLKRCAEEWGCSLKKLKVKIMAMNGDIREGIRKVGKRQSKGLRGIAMKEDADYD